MDARGVPVTDGAYFKNIIPVTDTVHMFRPMHSGCDVEIGKPVQMPSGGFAVPLGCGFYRNNWDGAFNCHDTLEDLRFEYADKTEPKPGESETPKSSKE